MIVTPGAQVNQLRNADVIADFHFNEVVDPRLLANPTMIADRKPPRKLDSNMRFNDNAATDACAKQSQQFHFKSAKRKPAPLQECDAAKVPQRAHREASPRIKIGVVEAFQISPGLVAQRHIPMRGNWEP